MGPVDPHSAAALAGVLADLRRFEFEEHAFEQLAVLREYYENRVDLGDLADEFLRVVGERGGTLPQRLGLPDNTPIDRLVAHAKERLAVWAALAEGPVYGPTHRAALTTRGSRAPGPPSRARRRI